jgi:hypothetical protein
LFHGALEDFGFSCREKFRENEAARPKPKNE